MLEEATLTDAQNKITTNIAAFQNLTAIHKVTIENMKAREEEVKSMQLECDIKAWEDIRKRLGKVQQQPGTDSPPPAKFRIGQSVLQYWASWFANEPENTTRAKAAQKSRAKWYIGDVLAGPEYQSIVYGGVRVQDYCYFVH